MESRVMGNCHARFGVGEKVNSGADAPLETLPITILRDGRRSHGIQAAGAVQQIHVRGAKPSCRSMGVRVSAPVSGGKYPGHNQEGF